MSYELIGVLMFSTIKTIATIQLLKLYINSWIVAEAIATIATIQLLKI